MCCCCLLIGQFWASTGKEVDCLAPSPLISGSGSGAIRCRMGGFKALSSVMKHSRRNVFFSTVSNFLTNWVSAKKEVHPASSYKRLLCQLRRQLTLHTINVMWCSKRSYIRSRKASKDRDFSTVCEYLSLANRTSIC